MEKKDYVWQCNECGSDEYTSALSEDDLDWLACGNCGCDEFHKEYITTASTGQVLAALQVKQMLDILYGVFMITFTSMVINHVYVWHYRYGWIDETGR